MTRIGLALFQPEIAGNVGAAIRNAACFDVDLHVIDPCGFPWKDRDIRRVALDYDALAAPHRHLNYDTFRAACAGRVILLTTKAATGLHDMAFQPGDVLLLGTESAGVPDVIHNAVDARVVIPLSPKARSLNMATAGAIGLAEMRRQLGYAP